MVRRALDPAVTVVVLAEKALVRIEVAGERTVQPAAAMMSLTVSAPPVVGMTKTSTPVVAVLDPVFQSDLGIRVTADLVATEVTAALAAAVMVIFVPETVTVPVADRPTEMLAVAMGLVAHDATATCVPVIVRVVVPPTAILAGPTDRVDPAVILVPRVEATIAAMDDQRETAGRVRAPRVLRPLGLVSGEPRPELPQRAKRHAVLRRKARKVALAPNGCATTLR